MKFLSCNVLGLQQALGKTGCSESIPCASFLDIPLSSNFNFNTEDFVIFIFTTRCVHFPALTTIFHSTWRVCRAPSPLPRNRWFQFKQTAAFVSFRSCFQFSAEVVLLKTRLNVEERIQVPGQCWRWPETRHASRHLQKHGQCGNEDRHWV